MSDHDDHVTSDARLDEHPHVASSSSEADPATNSAPAQPSDQRASRATPGAESAKTPLEEHESHRSADVSVVMSDEASRAAAHASTAPPPTMHDMRDALYADLEKMQVIRTQIEAFEAQYLATLRQLEVGQQLNRRLAELGPLADLSREDLRKAEEYARTEVGAEWAILTQTPPASGAARVERARQLVEEFPAVHAALISAEITPKLADVLCEIGAPISDLDARAAYEAEALDIAKLDDVTPQRVRPRVRRIAERLMASTREERHERAAKRRRVFVVEQSDGMSELVAVVPSVQAAGIYDRLTQVAKRLAGPGEPRCFDELRADVFSSLLLTGPVPDVPDEADALGETVFGDESTSDDARIVAGMSTGTSRGSGSAATAAALGDRSVLAPHQVEASVMVVVPALTLLGLDGEPATLNGMSPIPLADAALLAAHAPSWTRVLTCPTTGAPLAVDTYRPSAEQRAFLSIRDKHCRFPGCRAPARRCDIDHTKDWAHGGKTDVCNLSCLCRTHHTRKHAPAWSVTQKERGMLEWVTPTGRRVSDIPAPAGPTFTKTDIDRMTDRAQNFTHSAPKPRNVEGPAPPPPMATLVNASSGRADRVRVDRGRIGDESGNAISDVSGSAIGGVIGDAIGDVIGDDLPPPF